MNHPSDYQIELERTQKDIAGLFDSLAARPGDIEKATQLPYRLFHLASMTGNPAQFSQAEVAIDKAIQQFGPQEDLCLLKANLDFKFHNLPAVQIDLQAAPALLGRAEGRSMLADLAFQQGRYDEARNGYEEVIAENRTWDNLARLAYFNFKMGDFAAAEQLYLDAQAELTAKQMRSFAWLELQRGVLDLSRGQYDDTAAHYRRAEKAFSGSWLTDEHIAELLGAQGLLSEATARYENVISRAPKPEYQQALGELYSALGRTEEAERCYGQALTAYLDSAAQGEVQFYHHLADFYVDVREDGAQAVYWARKDIAVRDNFATQAALAWALCRAGEFKEALEQSTKALASGAQDARLFHQAGIIRQHAGRPDDAARFLSKAAELNPHHQCFHVHR